MFQRRQNVPEATKSLLLSQRETQGGVFLIVWGNVVLSNYFGKVGSNMGSGWSIFCKLEKTSFREATARGGSKENCCDSSKLMGNLDECCNYLLSWKLLGLIGNIFHNISKSLWHCGNCKITFSPSAYRGAKCRLRNINLSPPHFLMNVGNTTWKNNFIPIGLDSTTPNVW